jgi:heptosyltransferase-2
VNHVAPTPRRILAVKMAGLGDLLTATPAFRALRHTFSHAHIGVLATPGTAAALAGLDSVDQVLTFEKADFDRLAAAPMQLPRALELAQSLRDGNWDTLILLHHLTTPFGVAKYAALAMASGAQTRLGLDNGRGKFLTHRAPDHGYGARHEVDYWLDAVAVLGATHPGSPRPEMALTAEHRTWAAEQLGPDRPLVAIAPGSGSFAVARRWAPDRFAAVARALQAEYGLEPIVIGGAAPDELALANQVAAEIGGARVIPTAPSPQALAAVLESTQLVVSNDGGTVHVASTVGVPIVTVFGPSNDLAWAPYPPGPSHLVVRQPLACAPCIHRGHEFGTPEGCPARTCLAVIEPSDVLSAARRALSTRTEAVAA